MHRAKTAYFFFLAAFFFAFFFAAMIDSLFPMVGPGKARRRPERSRVTDPTLLTAGGVGALPWNDPNVARTSF
jgi:hypothetical protein